MPNSKDIYLVRMYYKGQSEAFKSRPVLILNNLGNGWVTIVEITSVPPKQPPSHYDKFKEPIIKWKQCGLANPSFIKCKNIHNIEISRLFKKIGIMEDDEFINIIDKIDLSN